MNDDDPNEEEWDEEDDPPCSECGASVFWRDDPSDLDQEMLLCDVCVYDVLARTRKELELFRAANEDVRRIAGERDRYRKISLRLADHGTPCGFKDAGPWGEAVLELRKLESETE